jgi:hypothetical protein
VPNDSTDDAGIEVVERLLLDRIDAEPGRAPVRGEHHRVAFALAHEAGAALAFVQPAVARAEVALDAAVGQALPPSAGVVAPVAPTAVAPLPLDEFLDFVARDADLRAPEVDGQPALRFSAAGTRGLR